MNGFVFIEKFFDRIYRIFKIFFITKKVMKLNPPSVERNY